MSSKKNCFSFSNIRTHSSKRSRRTRESGMFGIEYHWSIIFPHLWVRIRDLEIKITLNQYKIGSSLIIRDSLSLDLSLLHFNLPSKSYKCHFIEHKWNSILTRLWSIRKPFQCRTNCSSFEQFQLSLFVYFQWTMKIKLNLASTIVTSSTDAQIVTSILNEGSNTLVTSITKSRREFSLHMRLEKETNSIITIRSSWEYKHDRVIFPVLTYDILSLNCIHNILGWIWKASKSMNTHLFAWRGDTLIIVHIDTLSRILLSQRVNVNSRTIQWPFRSESIYR